LEIAVPEAQSVTEYRVERMRRAPRNWTYRVAFFTLRARRLSARAAHAGGAG